MKEKETKKHKAEEKKKEEKKPVETRKETKEEKKTPEIKTEKVEKTEAKTEEKKTGKKSKEAPKVPKKEEAVARGVNIHASTKQCQYICSFIKNKSIDQAITDLISVIRLKKAVPFKGEIPHRKGKGIMSGRYPVKASKLFINILKSLRGNIIINGMDLDNTTICLATASIAARPMKTEGREAKRTHVTIKAKEIKEKMKTGEKK